MSRINRRHFVRSSLALASSAALPACSSGTASSEGIDADVAIVGAGLAGLTAARQLVAEGFDVRVFEARDRVGGRTLNQTLDGGHVAEGGGQWVGPSQTEILGLAAELGIETFETHDRGSDVLVLEGQRFVDEIDAPSTPEEAAEIDAAVASLDALAREVPVEAPWTAPRAAEWDAQTVEDWLAANVASEAAWLNIDLAIGTALSTSSNRVSLLYFLFYVASAGGFRRLTDIRGGAQERRFVGGSQRISLELAAALGDRVELGSPVARIIDEGSGGVRIEAATTVRARRVIIAMMPADTRRIDFSPALPEMRRQLVEGWTGAAGFKAHLIYDEPFWRAANLSGQAFSDSNALSFTFDNSPPDGAVGILLGFAEPSLLPDTEEGRRQALADAAAEYFGDAARQPIGYVEKDWGRDPWSSGCVSPLGPGLLTRAGAALRQPVGRIHWAGTETSEIWTGYMDGAVRSGKRAAEEVAAELRRA